MVQSGTDETIYYIKQFYQEQVRPVRGQATLIEHPHIIDPSQHTVVNDFDNDIILFAYDIILKYGMILCMISDMIS